MRAASCSGSSCRCSAVAAVVLVDTMFYAAITPLLPQYADELEPLEDGSRCAVRRVSRGDPDRDVPRRVAGREAR